MMEENKNGKQSAALQDLAPASAVLEKVGTTMEDRNNDFIGNSELLSDDEFALKKRGPEKGDQRNGDRRKGGNDRRPDNRGPRPDNRGPRPEGGPRPAGENRGPRPDNRGPRSEGGPRPAGENRGPRPVNRGPRPANGPKPNADTPPNTNTGDSPKSE